MALPRIPDTYHHTISVVLILAYFSCNNCTTSHIDTSKTGGAVSNVQSKISHIDIAHQYQSDGAVYIFKEKLIEKYAIITKNESIVDGHHLPQVFETFTEKKIGGDLFGVFSVFFWAL